MNETKRINNTKKIISKRYAMKLLNNGKASFATKVIREDGRVFVAIDRLDLQCTQHYEI